MCIGLGAGIADIVPMIAQKLPAHSTVSVFLHYFFVSIVIVNMDLPHIPWWIEGGVVGLALTIPMPIQVGHAVARHRGERRRTGNAGRDSGSPATVTVRQTT